MENPAYWTHADRVIEQALRNHEKMNLAGYVGGSRAYCVRKALEEAGLLSEEKNPKMHNHFTRDIRPHDCEVCAGYYPDYP